MGHPWTAGSGTMRDAAGQTHKPLVSFLNFVSGSLRSFQVTLTAKGSPSRQSCSAFNFLDTYYNRVVPCQLDKEHFPEEMVNEIKKLRSDLWYQKSNSSHLKASVPNQTAYTLRHESRHNTSNRMCLAPPMVTFGQQAKENPWFTPIPHIFTEHPPTYEARGECWDGMGSFNSNSTSLLQVRFARRSLCLISNTAYGPEKFSQCSVLFLQ